MSLTWNDALNELVSESVNEHGCIERQMCMNSVASQLEIYTVSRYICDPTWFKNLIL